VRFWALALLWPIWVSAATPEWLIATPAGRAVAGEGFELVVAAPAGEEPPEEIALRARIEPAEVTIRLRATGPAAASRRSYAGTMPVGAGGLITLELADFPSNALVVLVARRDAMQRVTAPGDAVEEPLVSANDPVYFVIGARNGWDARFQLSFKYRLFDQSSGFGAEQPWLAGFYFGYTQTSLWDLSSESKPFHDTSYRPSAFWKWERTDQRTWIDGVRLGVEHESNGSQGERSRSINTVFARPEWRFPLARGGTLEFTPKIYAYLTDGENPDIAEYRGYVDWRVRYDAGGAWITTAVARLGTTGRGSLQLDMSRRTRDMKLGPLSGYLHLQFFNGWGEDILDYNVRRPAQLRIGLAIVP
jgi:outer membrane phospholipase A